MWTVYSVLAEVGSPCLILLLSELKFIVAVSVTLDENTPAICPHGGYRYFSRQSGGLS